MSDELIADIPNEGEVIEDSVFEQAEDNVEKTASESQPEKKQTEKPSQEGDNTPDEPTPFHKHPRWIKTQERLKNYEKRFEEYESKFKEVEPLLKQRQDTELPDWWKNTYGNTSESKDAYRKYEETTKAERDRIKSEVLDEIQAQQTQSLQADDQAKEYIESEVEAMQDEGLKFQTNELMKFIIDFQDKYGAGSLLDTQGNYDLRKALNLMQELRPEEKNSSTETKKRIASETISSKGSSQSKSEVPKVSKYALRRGNWRDAE